MRDGQLTAEDGLARRRAKVEAAVRAWSEQLVDLTGRNRLLYFKDQKKGTLDLTSSDPERLDAVLRGGTVLLSKLYSPTEERSERLDDAIGRAKTIHRKALALYEERGIDTLFAGFGLATWTSTTSSATPAAPVLLCPLGISPRGAAEADFEVSLAGDWEVNDLLAQLLAGEFNVEVDPYDLLDRMSDTSTGVGRARQVFEQLEVAAAQVPGFAVTERIIAGTFAYTKQPMVVDLREHVEELTEHDLIAAVAGDEGARQALREGRPGDVDPSLPDFTPPADEYLVLDADASQNHAINTVVAGESLIIQGPPGTGKSQTIANLISTSIARGRKVLFVAEKRAAIDAVMKRLHAVGLDDLVLDLHGGVSSRRQLAEDLSKTLQRVGQTPPVQARDLHRRLETSRKALRDHDEALHERRGPWEVSIHDVEQALIRLRGDTETTIRFAGQRITDLDSDTARSVREDLVEWAGLSEPIRTGRSPWAGAEVRSDADAETVLDLVDSLAADEVPSAQRELDDVLRQTGLPRPNTLEDWQRTLALLDGVAKTLDQVDSSVFENVHPYATALERGGRGAGSRAAGQLFDSEYRQAKKAVRELWRQAGKPNGAVLFEVVATARNQADEWTALGGEGTPRLPARLEDAERRYSTLTERLAALAAYLVTRDLRQRPHDELPSDVSALISDQQMLFRLPRIHELEQRLRSLHLDQLLDEVNSGGIESDDVVPVFDLAWYGSIRTALVARDPRLANFDGTLQDRHAEEFQLADTEHIESTAHRVRRAVAEQAVATCNEHPDQDELVRREAKKKTRHLPLRALFTKAPDVLTALRPCWTMSPLVVSQTLPATQVFDLVIFDEASQVLPPDAIPALLRAPQAVVAGDRHQLPPTTFFDAATDDDTEVDEGEEDDTSLTKGFESILDVLDSLLRSRMLTWHYRSEDERLIAFSNHQIYDRSLTTFPGASSDGCLGHVLVPHRPGVPVDTRSSDDEVVTVVDLVLEKARTSPEETLGVIAMGSHHASRVEAALRERLGDLKDPGLEEFFDESREERAFVKNLERVQGDERDNIIFTVGYAKKSDGRLNHHFGPINHEGGQRRLNVAVTRAKRSLTLVSSFSHTDLDPNRSSAVGFHMLRDYLKYAETGGESLGDADGTAPLNPFEIDVKYRLERAGLTVIPQYGTSGFRIDFAVPHPDLPGKFVLAIEADGASYHSSPSSRDRDRLRQQVLEARGWRFHRIWSTDWFNDPEKEVLRIVERHEDELAAIARGDRPPTSLGRGGPSAAEAKPVSSHSVAPAASRTQARPSVPRYDSITEYRHDQLVALARWISSDGLLRTNDQLLAEMMDELGFARRGKRIVAALQKAIDAC